MQWHIALLLAAFALLVVLGACNVVAWLVLTARDESLLLRPTDPSVESYHARGSAGEALSVLYVTHRHRLCIDFGADGWDAAVPAGTALALRSLRDAGVTVGLPCTGWRQVLRCTDAVSVSIAVDAIEGVATAIPGAFKVLLLLTAVRPNMPSSVDDALARGMRVVVHVADQVTAQLVHDMAWIAGWDPAAVTVVRMPARAPGPHARPPLSDVVDTLHDLTAGPSVAAQAGGGRDLHCVAMWISPDNEVAFSDAPKLSAAKVAVLPYDACFDEDVEALARLHRRRPMAETVVVDTQQLLPANSRGVDTRRRLVTCIMSPVVLYAPRMPGIPAADNNPLVALIVRRVAATSPMGTDGSTDARSAELATLALNTGIALHLPILPSTVAMMAETSRAVASDMVAGDGDEAFSRYDTNGGPLDPSIVPRRAVLEQWTETKHAHLAPDRAVPGFLVSIRRGRRVFATESRWIGGVRLRPGDHVELRHQTVARENGRYVVLRDAARGPPGSGVRMATASQGIYVPTDAAGSAGPAGPAGTGSLVHDGDVGVLMPPTDDRWTVQAPPGSVRDPEPDLLEAGDAVWLSNVNTLATWTARGDASLIIVPATTSAALFVDADDTVQQDKFSALARCVTDPNSTVQQACEAKPGGVWDRPCVTDLDCPFFQKNRNYRNYRGGCDVAGSGYCEMPIGVKRLSYRKYDTGAASRPVCYGCDERDDACCRRQGDAADYAFLGDLKARLIPTWQAEAAR